MDPKAFEKKARDVAKHALDYLADVACGLAEPDRQRISACNEILNRAYGKAPDTSHDPWEGDFVPPDLAALLNTDEPTDRKELN